MGNDDETPEHGRGSHEDHRLLVSRGAVLCQVDRSRDKTRGDRADHDIPDALEEDKSRVRGEHGGLFRADGAAHGDSQRAESKGEEAIEDAVHDQRGQRLAEAPERGGREGGDDAASAGEKACG